MKQALQDTFEAVVEQVVGPKQKKTTAGLGAQLDPGKLFTDMLKQGGVKTDKPIKTPEELKNATEEERKEAEVEANKQREELGIKTIQPQQPKGNIEVINPPKPQQQTPAPYITGKSGYNPEKQAQLERDKDKLPPLEVPKGKPPRGSWISAMERKKHGAEIKGAKE